MNRTQISCYDNVLKYTNVYTVPPDFAFSREAIQNFITPTIREQTRRVYKTRIFLADDLTAQSIAVLQSLQNPGLILVGDAVYIDPTRFDRTRGMEEILRTTDIS